MAEAGAQGVVDTSTVVIGASAAGLAAAAGLHRAGHDHLLLERADRVGATWRGHYDRLHLHTDKGSSALPGVGFGRELPRYPSRDQVVAYLERYVDEVGLQPRFGEEVISVGRDGDAWVTRSGGVTYRSSSVVVATGMARVPSTPDWPGAADYTGELLHSAAYRTGAPWSGKRVLVVGFGNSAGEIVLDLHEHGAQPTLAVRGAVNVIPRELLGVPILRIGSVLGVLPPRVADRLGAPLVRWSVGDLRRVGLRRPPYGPIEQIHRDGRVPLIDVGTIAAIRAGHVRVRGEVVALTATGVRFADGTEEAYDAVVAATGYRSGLADLLEPAVADAVLDDAGHPRASGEVTLPGLFFCGFWVSPIGMLRQIGVESTAIATAITAG